MQPNPQTQGGNPVASEFDKQLQLLVDDVSKLSTQLSAILRGLKKVAREDSFSVLLLLKSVQDHNLLRHFHEETTRLVEVLAQDANNRIMTFDADLRQELEIKGRRIEGQWPHYHVQLILKVDVYEMEMFVRVGGQKIRTLFVPTVIAAIEKRLQEIESRRIAPDIFLQRLGVAHDRLVPVHENKSVSIWQVFRQLVCDLQSPAFWKNGRARLFRDFDQDDFRSGLTELLIHNQLVLKDGRELRLLPPINPEDGVYLYQPAEGRFGYVGRIAFQ